MPPRRRPSRTSRKNKTNAFYFRFVLCRVDGGARRRAEVGALLRVHALPREWDPIHREGSGLDRLPCTGHGHRPQGGSGNIGPSRSIVDSPHVTIVGGSTVARMARVPQCSGAGQARHHPGQIPAAGVSHPLSTSPVLLESALSGGRSPVWPWT
eukprot:scaffold22305_cov123-Isochrysis_galbana.AAC.1